MVLVQFLAILPAHALPMFPMLLKQEAVKLPHSFPPIAITWKAQQFEMCRNTGFIHLHWHLGHRVINLLKFFDFQKLTALLYFEIRVDPFYQVEGHTWEQYYFYLQKKNFISGFLDFAALEVLILEDQNRDLGEYISSPT